MSGYTWSLQDYIYVTAECLTGVLSVVGNGLVLLAIWRTRALQTVTNCFIGSLALSDILVGILVPPTAILPYRGLPKHFHGCVLLNTVVVLITNISILNLLAVALERFLAISDPFRYQRIMSIKIAMVVVVITWIIAILIGLIPTMGWNLGSEGFQECAFTKVIDMRYMIYLIFFGVNIPPLVFMLIIYLYIFHIIRQQQRSVAHLTVFSGEERRHARQQKKEIRGAKGLAFVIILFAICWMPIHILNCITLFAPSKSPPYYCLLVAIVLSHANSFMNPFLYAFSNSQFKRAMKSILYCGRLPISYASDSSEGNTYHRNSRGSATNGLLKVAALGPPNGNMPDQVIDEELYNEGPEQAINLSNNHNGVINEAFDEENRDASEQVASPDSMTFPKKILRWSETVENIPASSSEMTNSKSFPMSDLVNHKENNIFVISDSDLLHGQARTSPSQQFTEIHDLRPSPSLHKEEFDSPDEHASGQFNSALQSDIPGAGDQTGDASLHQSEAKNWTGSLANQDSSSAAVTLTPVCVSSCCSEQVDKTRTESEGQELNVIYSCSVDEEGHENEFGSKEFVSVRL